MSRVSIAIGAAALRNVARASVRKDVLELADSFDITLDPVTDRVRAHVREDAEVIIQIDGIRVMTGYIDEVHDQGSRSTRSVAFRGRDKAGRLVDEPMPLGRIAEQDIQGVAERAAGPWFSRFALSNTANRRLVRGRGVKAAAGAEPIFDRIADAQLRVEPGQTRAEVLRRFLEPARLLAWSSGDGHALIVAKPNRRQRPQYSLSTRQVVSISRSRSVAERGATYKGYAQPVIDGERYRLRAEGSDPLGSFQRRKEVAIVGQADSRRRLRKELDAEIARRTQQADQLNLSVMGFAQRYTSHAEPTLFAPDTVARVDLPAHGIRGDYYLTAVTYDLMGRDAETSLELSPTHLEIFA